MAGSRKAARRKAKRASQRRGPKPTATKAALKGLTSGIVDEVEAIVAKKMQARQGPAPVGWHEHVTIQAFHEVAIRRLGEERTKLARMGDQGEVSPDKLPAHLRDRALEDAELVNLGLPAQLPHSRTKAEFAGRFRWIDLLYQEVFGELQKLEASLPGDAPGRSSIARMRELLLPFLYDTTAAEFLRAIALANLADDSATIRASMSTRGGSWGGKSKGRKAEKAPTPLTLTTVLELAEDEVPDLAALGDDDRRDRLRGLQLHVPGLGAHIRLDIEGETTRRVRGEPRRRGGYLVVRTTEPHKEIARFAWASVPRTLRRKK